MKHRINPTSLKASSTKIHAWRNISLLQKRPERQQSIEPELESWLQSQGLPEQKVELARYDLAGRGLKAYRGIGKGEQLLRIPHSALLTAERAADVTSRLGLGKDLPTWSLLAVALCDARFGSGNDWSAYAHALPIDSGCILEWSDEEVAMLRGSTALGLAEQIRRANSASIQELDALRQGQGLNGSSPQALLSKSNLRWAFSMLLSRLVRLPSLQNNEALCPWADMINHDCKATAHLDFDRSKNCALLATDRSYKAGEQVMASYGQKTSAELLLSYGFYPAPSENPHDATPLRVAISNDDRDKALKADLLMKYGFGASHEFPIRLGGFPNGLLQYAAFTEVELEDSTELRELADWLFDKGQFPKADGVDTEILGMEVVKGLCKDQLNKLEASKKGSQSLQTDPKTQNSRESWIQQIKSQEKRILDRTVYSLQQQIKSLS